jgi:D-alanyl-D-alanine carboxypeptidase (penicillin-binding protein 5/6)
MMSERALELGMNDTQFKNASGIDQEGQFSTARDIATMSRFALDMPEIREIVGIVEVELDTQRAQHSLTNTNVLLQSYDGATGIKTGFTRAAGFSISMSAQRDDLELIAVVLGTRDDLARFFDARSLLDFGFTHYRTQNLAIKNAVVGRAQVTNFPDRTVQVAVGEDVVLPVLDLAGPIDQIIEIDDVRSPIKRGDRLGHISFTQRGRLVARVPLVATQDVSNPFFLVQWYYNAVIALRGDTN